MNYCPEIAILHGAFACIETESKNGNYDLLHHTKGDKSRRAYQLMKDVAQEIVAGLEAPRGASERKKWSQHLHHVLFCKAFVFSTRFASRDVDLEKCSSVVSSFRAWCLPLPDFHPHFFFDLAEEFDWAEFHGEMTAALDLPTTLTFVRHSLSFCTPDPSLLYDLSLISTTLDCLLSLVASEIVGTSEAKLESAQTTVPQNKDGATPTNQNQNLFPQTVPMSQMQYQDLHRRCRDAAFESEDVKRESEAEEGGDPDVEKDSDMDHTTKVEIFDAANQLMLDHVLEQLHQNVQDSLTQVVDLALEALKQVQKRMSTKLFDRSSCKRGAMASVLPVLGRILSSVIVFCVLTVFDEPSHVVQVNFTEWLLVKDDEDEDPDSGSDANRTEGSQNGSEPDSSLQAHTESINLVAEAFSLSMKTSEARTVCLKCLSSFFAVQTTNKEIPSQKLSKEKSVKFGRVLKLSHSLSRLSRPLKVVEVVKNFSELLPRWSSEVKEAEELTLCVSSIVAELEKREKMAEEKRRNPSLADVMDRVQRKLPRWEYCLQYGLAKRDLKDWWFAGFLDFLHKYPSLLSTESDFRHLVDIFRQIAKDHPRRKERDVCAELVSKTFSQLPPGVQEKILVERQADVLQPSLLLVSDFEQMLTVVFNKVSASVAHKNLCDILPLALQDLLTFTRYAVGTAVSSEGQIPLVVKVFQLIPAVMRSSHPLHHPHRSLLSHCLHSVLQNRSFDSKEQTNFVNLLSSLVKPTVVNSSHNPPLLPPAEFLSSSVLPLIVTALGDRDSQSTSLFALRLLIGCLKATLSVGFSDWLEELNPAVLVMLCGEMLQDCLGWTSGDGDTENGMGVRVVVLDVVDCLLKHFAVGGVKIEGKSLGWLLQGCANLDWVVCAYLAPFLAPGDADNNLLISGYVTEVMKNAAENATGLLLLSAISDSAAQRVIDAVHDGLRIPHTSLVISLSQVLPSILVREVHPVVLVLTALVTSGCVDMELRHRSLLEGAVLDLSESRTQMVVCQLLTEAVAVAVKGEDNSDGDNDSGPLLHHVGQVLVAALQTLTRARTDGEEWQGRHLLAAAVFHQVCAVMADGPDAIVDPLFVLLLDLLPSHSLQDAKSRDGEIARDVLEHGIALVRSKSCWETLMKTLNPQSEESVHED